MEKKIEVNITANNVNSNVAGRDIIKPKQQIVQEGFPLPIEPTGLEKVGLFFGKL